MRKMQKQLDLVEFNVDHVFDVIQTIRYTLQSKILHFSMARTKIGEFLACFCQYL